MLVSYKQKRSTSILVSLPINAQQKAIFKKKRRIDPACTFIDIFRQILRAYDMKSTWAELSLQMIRFQT